jgi:hypothetical protein
MASRIAMSSSSGSYLVAFKKKKKTLLHGRCMEAAIEATVKENTRRKKKSVRERCG